MKSVTELEMLQARQAKLKRRAAAIAEEERLQQRANEKAAIAALRQEMIRRRNAQDMYLEDIRSHKLRFYNWEQDRIRCELAEMKMAEREQTLIDKFWGIPTYILREKEEAERRRLEWQLQVDSMREMCLQVKIMRPFDWEVGKFRDKFTNEILK